MTIVTVDSKKRVTVRDSVPGDRMILTPEGKGYRLEPVPNRNQARRASPRGIGGLLKTLADEGFSFTPAKKQKVKPCPF